MIARSPAVVALLAALIAFFCVSHKGDALDALVSQAKPHWNISIKFSDQPIKVGVENVAFDVTVGQSGYLTLVERGTDGTLNVLFPNSLDQDTHVEAGTIHLPRTSWMLRATPPAGAGRVVAVITREKPDAAEMKRKLEAGELPEFGADYGAAVASYIEAPGELDKGILDEECRHLFIFGVKPVRVGGPGRDAGQHRFSIQRWGKE